MGQYFRNAGYRTAAFGKMHVHGEEVKGWDLGFDERDLRFYTRAPGMHYADLNDGDFNRRYREMEPYSNTQYREIDAERFARAPAGLTVKQNGVNEHFLETLVEHEDEMIDHLVTNRSIDFIERKTATGEPFMVHVGLEKPHRPWTVHQKFLDRFDPDKMPLPETIAEWVEKGMHPFVQRWSHSGIKGDAARNSTAAYYACASQIDDCVGRIMEKCTELGILDNTIIIYTSDHGENLYEHGLIEKHNMLDLAVRVPFIMRAPWVFPPGGVCDSPASLIDMIPTLCELSAVQGSSELEGESLVAATQGNSDPQRMIFSEFYQEGSCTRKDEFMPVRMGLYREFKYIYTHAAADQLYDRHSDGEQTGDNLAVDPAQEALVSHLKLQTLDGWELDEYPQLSANVRVSGEGVQITWESAAAGARYDVYRSTSIDTRKAERVASGLDECSWLDEAPVDGRLAYYWVLGHYQLDLPYVDPRGKSRFGDQPILSLAYPRSLPVTRPLKVLLEEGFTRTFIYEPLLGCTFGGQDWIHIGNNPVSDGNGVRLSGPVTILSPKPVSGNLSFSAELCTPRPGPKPQDTLHLVFQYQNVHRYYSVALKRDGSVSLWKRTGEWTFELLASTKAKQARPGDWQDLGTHFQDGAIAVFLNGQQVLTATDPNPYLEGRFGFDAPLHLGDARVRALTCVI
jgi:arylsulfatase A-like enzyme